VEFEGEFRVPGRPEEVILRFADVERMARCMPGAVIDGRDEEGAWLGGMVVAFGPKRIKFKGKLTAETDPVTLSGSVQGRGAADLRAARVAVRIGYTVRADPEAPDASIVALKSAAELTGVLADFARTGGVPFATALMEEFSKRAAEEFARDALPPTAEAEPTRAEGVAVTLEASHAAATAAAPAPPTPSVPPPLIPAQPLHVHWLLWAVVKAKLLALLARLGLGPTAQR
jgi:carbon monoxide dehydrogenase subunit G